MTENAPSPDPLHLELLGAANRRLVSRVGALDDAMFNAPSLLPDWSVGHVLAHLALNAEGLAGALEGVASGAGTPMYASQQARDRDIAELGAAPPGDVRARLLAAIIRFDGALDEVPPETWGTRIERTPGHPAFSARATAMMRLREVEIHHADLGVGYSPADWASTFSALTIDSMSRQDVLLPFRVHAVDLDRDWNLGEGEPEVTVRGTSHALAWWLTGRGDGAGLESDSGALPTIEPW